MQTLFVKFSLLTQFVLTQIKLEGLDEAAKTSPLNAALVGFILLLLAGIAIIWRRQNELGKELKELNQEHANKLEENRKDYVDKFDKIQNEYLKREEERNKQWSESEKQTLQVLNGVTSILEMGEKMGQKDTKDILEKLKIVEERIINAINANK